MPSATPPDPTPLTREEQSLLAAIATQEHRRDSRFANSLAAGVVPVARHPGRSLGIALGVVALLVAAPLVLSAAWVLAIAAVVLLVVAPTGLVIWALAQGRVDPDAAPLP